jgi:hypothetical protein
MGRSNSWSIKALQFIRDNAATMKDRELAEKLSEMTGKTVSTQSARKQRQKIHILKESGRGKCVIKGSIPATTPTTPPPTSLPTTPPDGV